MAVNINVPSQVKTYANLAAFPASGALKTIYIAEDTNKTYRWTGSVYVEVSAAGATGITIGTTAIASGTVGRVLFEGTGNVVQESANLFWDETNGRLGIGTNAPSNNLQVLGASGTIATVKINTANRATGMSFRYSDVGDSGSLTYNNIFYFTRNDNTFPLYLSANSNVLINTITDAGFRLDVNGTSRITGLAYQTGYSYSVQRLQFNQGVSTTNVGYINGISNGVIRLTNASETDFTRLQFGGGTTSYPSLQRSGSALSVMDATGTALTNLLVGTTTDAGFRLDVNGTARVSGTLTTANINLGGSQLFFNQSAAPNNYIYSASNISILNGVNVRLAGGPVSINATNGGAAADASSLLDVQSTTRGFLPPRMTTTQKNAIVTPATGLMVYDTTLTRPCFYDGTTWITL